MCAIMSVLHYFQPSLWLPYSNKAYCICGFNCTCRLLK